MKTKQERIALLEETAAHYKLDTRALDLKGRCTYWSEEKQCGCAIGRKLPIGLARALTALHVAKGPKASDVHEYWEFFPEDLQQYGKNFLKALQILHDGQENWTEDGLSEKGRDYVEEIRRDLEREEA